ncbi:MULTISPECIES: cytochrome b [Rheinheimera]|uniref:Cytochrome b n=1 Tax=Rheinheimera marina TaxID=1774958 RepID=A0ABV9JL46_9GAMM
MSSQSTKYSSVIIGLHWLSLILMVLVYLSMESRSLFERGSDARDLVKALHYSLALTLLLLTGFRVLARLLDKAPPIVPSPTMLAQRLTGLGHLLIYGWMLGMILLGYLVLSLEGHDFQFWGLSVPLLTGEDSELAHQLEDVHKLGATLGYYLIGGHALMALWHHYGRKDNTLYRMLPLAKFKSGE